MRGREGGIRTCERAYRPSRQRRKRQGASEREGGVCGFGPRDLDKQQFKAIYLIGGVSLCGDLFQSSDSLFSKVFMWHLTFFSN